MALAAVEVSPQFQLYRLGAGLQGKSLKRTMGSPIATPHVPALPPARAATASLRNAPALVGIDSLEGLTHLRHVYADHGHGVQEEAFHDEVPAATRVRDLFGVTSFEEVQDVLASLALSEVVYRALDGTLEAAVHHARHVFNNFPGQLLPSHWKLQWSQDHVNHRYMVAECGDAMYVAFMGTKQRRDLFTNANAGMDFLWPEADDRAEAGAAAHRGFLNRARSVDIASLHALARSRGQRLVLCGHSLGGAVASLAALELLRRGGKDGEVIDVSCYGFATPAIGNGKLALLAEQRGWADHIHTYLMPEDSIGTLFNRSTPPAGPSNMVRPASVQTLDLAYTLSGSPAIPDQTPQGLPSAGNSPRFGDPIQVSSAWVEEVTPRDPWQGLQPGTPDAAAHVQGSDNTKTNQAPHLMMSTPHVRHASVMQRGFGSPVAGREASSVGVLDRTLSSQTAPGQLDTRVHYPTGNAPATSTAHGVTRDAIFSNVVPLPASLVKYDRRQRARFASHQDIALHNPGNHAAASASRAGSNPPSTALIGTDPNARSAAVSVVGTDPRHWSPMVGPRDTDPKPASPTVRPSTQPVSTGPRPGRRLRLRVVVRLTTQAVARTITFPIWAVREYAPVGRQVYLNRLPNSVTFRSTSSSSLASMDSRGSGDSAEELDVVALPGALDAPDSSSRNVLWMHRLPAYRGRVRSLLHHALQDSQEGSGTRTAVEVRMADGVGPALRVLSVHALHPLQGPGSAAWRGALEATLVLAGMARACAQHLRWAVEEVAGSLNEVQPRQRRGPRWLAWATKPLRWLAGRPWTPLLRASQPDVGVLLQVDGEGLGHVTHVGVRALDGAKLYPAEVLIRPEAGNGPQRSAASLSVIRAWLQAAHWARFAASAPRHSLLLRARLPLHVVEQLSAHTDPCRDGEARRLTLELKSDLHTVQLPVSYCGASRWPLPASKTGIRSAVARFQRLLPHVASLNGP